MVTILLITACAVTCDADGFTAVWQWVQDAPEPVLARLRVRLDPLTAQGRPPSETTIRRTIARVDAQAVEQAAGGFIAARLAAVGLGSTAGQPGEREARRARHTTGQQHRPLRQRRRIAFDGKVMRGARRPDGTRVTLLAGACHDSGTVMTQREITAKSNETPQLREQVTTMDLTGVLATADAAHCQRDTAEQIITAGGDYLLILKANQGNLLHAAEQLLTGTDTEWAPRSHHSMLPGAQDADESGVRGADEGGTESDSMVGKVSSVVGKVPATVHRSGSVMGPDDGNPAVWTARGREGGPALSRWGRTPGVGRGSGPRSVPRRRRSAAEAGD